VIEVIGNRDSINQRYARFKAEKAAIGKNNKYNQRLKSLEETFQYHTGSLIQVKELFVGVTANPQTSYKWIAHPLYDLAILIFENLDKPLYQSHARFVKDSSSLKQGKFLCRLGFPFPEFTNYHYNVSTDDIEWTPEGRADTPRFPIEGMLTRHIMQHGEIAGLELSTPGLRGQSGGPLFDERGLICGMQSGTQHLHLGFDMKNLEYNINGRKIRVNNQPFLHVGYCVHADIIKNFLRQHQVKFYEE
jgi:hypothetical protein